MQHLTYLDLGGHVLTNEDMRHVGQLANVKHISIYGADHNSYRSEDISQITNDGLACLVGLTDFTFLDLHTFPFIARKGLRQVGRCTNLRRLNLSTCGCVQSVVADDDLRHLINMVSLTPPERIQRFRFYTWNMVRYYR